MVRVGHALYSCLRRLSRQQQQSRSALMFTAWDGTAIQSQPPSQRVCNSKARLLASAAGGSASVAPGLFGTLGLHHPQDLLRRAADAQNRCNELLAELLNAPLGASVVQLMDDMSDQLCRNYDAAECCRQIHTDRRWRDAAEKVCSDLGVYIHSVNHHQGLYDKVAATMAIYQRSRDAAAGTPVSSPDSVSYSASQLAADSSVVDSSSGHRNPLSGWGSQLIQGYDSTGDNSASSRSIRPGPLLSKEELAKFDPETVRVGFALAADMEQAGIGLPPGPRKRVQELLNANNHYAAQFNVALGSPGAGADPGLLSNTLCLEPRESVRRQAFMTVNTTPTGNRQLLHNMLSARFELAQALSQPSYAAYRARMDSLAGNPAAAEAFLEQLSEQIKPLADADIQALSRRKAADTGWSSGPGGTTQLQPWDVEYYSHAAKRAEGDIPRGAVAEYLQLGSVLSGFCSLMQQLLGIRMTLTDAPAAEAWAPHVLKLSVEDPNNGPAGTVYLDLCSRPNKPPCAVTFPITCGRVLPNDAYQSPVMALLADFGISDPRSTHQHLQPQHLRVLLHELGHCCHNLLSRTRYQHLWGTRCAQDVVEIPSHLWEHFATDPRTLQWLARHRSSRDPMPRPLIDALNKQRTAFAALNLQQQVMLSLVDQRYHGRHPPLSSATKSEEGTSGAWAALAARHSSHPFAPDTSPELRMGHLAAYGGTYYSYVYARVLSAELWRTYLQEDPQDPGAGDILKRRLLLPGGTEAPLHIVQDLLGKDSMQQLHGGWAPRVDPQLLAGMLAAS